MWVLWMDKIVIKRVLPNFLYESIDSTQIKSKVCKEKRLGGYILVYYHILSLRLVDWQFVIMRLRGHDDEISLIHRYISSTSFFPCIGLATLSRVFFWENYKRVLGLKMSLNIYHVNPNEHANIQEGYAPRLGWGGITFYSFTCKSNSHLKRRKCNYMKTKICNSA